MDCSISFSSARFASCLVPWSSVSSSTSFFHDIFLLTFSVRTFFLLCGEQVNVESGFSAWCFDFATDHMVDDECLHASTKMEQHETSF